MTAEVVALQGDVIDIVCDTSGIPSPRISWQKGAKVITNNPGKCHVCTYL